MKGWLEKRGIEDSSLTAQLLSALLTALILTQQFLVQTEIMEPLLLTFTSTKFETFQKVLLTTALKQVHITN